MSWRAGGTKIGVGFAYMEDILNDRDLVWVTDQHLQITSLSAQCAICLLSVRDGTPSM